MFVRNYIVALVCTVISLLGFAGLTDVHRLLCFGGAMASAMWISAWYVVRNADEITARAAQEKW